jgi:hypothetical protein
MKDLDVCLEDISFSNGTIYDIVISAEINGDTWYFAADDIELDIDDIDYEVDYQDREPDVGIDWEGNYIEDFDLKDSIVVDNIYPLDDSGDDMSEQPQAKKVMEEYGDILKKKAEEVITDKLYKKYDEEIEEWILDYVNDHSDYEPDYEDYYND